jgi:hypothetical protein
MARGRDAVDAALTTTFGPVTLSRFEIICDEDRSAFTPPNTTAGGATPAFNAIPVAWLALNRITQSLRNPAPTGCF